MQTKVSIRNITLCIILSASVSKSSTTPSILTSAEDFSPSTHTRENILNALIADYLLLVDYALSQTKQLVQKMFDYTLVIERDFNYLVLEKYLYDVKQKEKQILSSQANLATRLQQLLTKLQLFEDFERFYKEIRSGKIAISVALREYHLERLTSKIRKEKIIFLKKLANKIDEYLAGINLLDEKNKQESLELELLIKLSTKLRTAKTADKGLAYVKEFLIYLIKF